MPQISERRRTFAKMQIPMKIQRNEKSPKDPSITWKHAWSSTDTRKHPVPRKVQSLLFRRTKRAAARAINLSGYCIERLMDIRSRCVRTVITADLWACVHLVNSCEPPREKDGKKQRGVCWRQVRANSTPINTAVHCGSSNESPTTVTHSNELLRANYVCMYIVA